MSNLKDAIDNLVSEATAALSASILTLIASQPVSELANLGGEAAPARAASSRGPKLSSTGRLVKRTSEQMDEVIDQIVDVLTSSKESLSSEQLQVRLSLDKKEIQRPVLLALERKLISKVGEKRATKYFIASVGGAAKPKRVAGPKKVKAKPVKKATAKKAKPAKKKKARTIVVVAEQNKPNASEAEVGADA